jgi:hypothetical protein
MTQHRRIRTSKLALGLLAALAAAPAMAQSTSAGVGGTVLGSGGSPVAGAEVTITHVESGTVSRATTDAAGRYTARGLRVGGPYTVTITKPGEGTKTEDGVYLDLAKVNTVDANLTGDVTNLGSVQAIGYGGGSEVFSATKMGSGTSVNQQTIQSLPSINGNIQDYMRLDPRVTFTDRASGSITAGGMNPRFNRIAIDGVSASDTFGLEGNNMPTQRQPVSMEAIEAIDIDLSNYDVTISGAAGANVNAVTKSGTNEFHGSVYGYMRDGDWFGDYPDDAQAALAGQKFAEFTKEKTYGATVGGPIVKDKLFFFANYEKYTRGKPGPVVGATPLGSPTGDFDADDVAAVQDIARNVWGFDPGGLSGNGDTELEEKAIKFDWNISDSHRASLRYSKLDQERVRPEGSSSTVLALSSNWYNHVKTNESYVGQLFSDWTDNFSTEFKVSRRNYDAVRVTPTTAPGISVFFDDGNATNLLNAGDAIRLGTERSSMGNALLTKTWNYFGAATWTLGDHDLKFGAEFSSNEIYNFFLQDAWGNYSFYVPTVNGAHDFSNLRSGTYFDYDLQTNPNDPASVAAQYKNKSLGLFVQDTWYATQNLTLTFGVRADKPSTSPDPTYNACFANAPLTPLAGCGTGYTGGFGLDNSQTYSSDFVFQPRLGFNYTFNSERPTQLRGGVGLFQGDAPQVWVGNAYSSTGLNYVAYGTPGSYSAPNGTNATISCDGVYSRAQNCIPFSADGLNPSIPGSTASASRNVNVIGDDFKLPSVWKANLAFDTELPWYGVVASAELLLTKVKDGLFYRSLNVGPGFVGPDGRTLYWTPGNGAYVGASGTRLQQARAGRNTYFGDVYSIENTDKGDGQQFTVSLSKPFSEGSDWSWMLGYTYTQANEVAALTSSTAGSGYGGQLGFNVNEPSATTARYEIKDRISGSLDWRHKFFGDYETQVGLVYEGRSGRPYSYIFSGDANGDSRTFNDLFYVPKQGEVLFGTFSGPNAVFTPNAATERAFYAWLDANPELKKYQGSYAPENGFRSSFVNTFDLRISQELPGFMKGHKSKIWVDIQNVGNLINKDWGHIIDYGFNANNSVATLQGISNGKYVYSYRAGTEFGQASALGIPTDADGQTNGISQWSLQVGVRYEF